MRARGAMPLTRADARAEQRGVDGVAGDDRRDVRAVAVGVFRRAELAGVELVAREEAVEVEASADDLVVAVARLEARRRPGRRP